MAAASPARLAIGLLIAGAAAFSPAPATAKPKPDESKLRVELKQLNSKVDKLINTYNAKRVELAEAQRAARTAKKRLAAAEEALATAEKRVVQIAQMRYQSGASSLPTFMLPLTGAGAAVMEQLVAEQQAVVDGFTAIRDERKQAADEAAALAAKIREDTTTVAGQRDEAEDVIEDIEKKLLDLVPVSSGRRADGTWAPQLPSGADHITPRTRAMRDLIKNSFALPFTVGCYRAGSSGEHPLGRACDFMLSSGGTMPTAAHQALGDQIAAWTVANRAKLGVKYVIWKQRINHGSGWSPMANRGSITENHFDHVHISMH